MAASRVYLGYHWLTDVLAGLAVGTAVLAAVAFAAHVVVEHGSHTGVPQVAPRHDPESDTSDGKRQHLD